MFVMSPTIGKLAEALAIAQGQFELAKKNATNPHLKSRYADLASCYEASRSVLSKCGLAVVQLPGRREDGTTTLMTVLLHASGEWLGEEAGVKIAQETPQTVGSALTYLRRYAYSSALGLATEDDDGVAATSHAAPPASAGTSHRADVSPTPRDERPTPQPPAATSSDRNDPSCPICQGQMWDNRKRKAEGSMSAKAPDFKCRDKACEGVIWPPRSSSKARPAPPPPPVDDYPPPPNDDDNEIPF